MELDLNYARKLDGDDSFHGFRSKFHIPKHSNGQDEIYLCGNSLGLQPKRSMEILREEMEKWATCGVRGHFEGERPWMPFHKFLMSGLASIVGANETEVIAMNSLTSNLHFMMVSFYRPSATRFKIILEEHAFPSDHFAVESQIKFHGFDPNEAMILISPREGEETLRPEDVIKTIQDHGEQTALVMLPGVQYYTGQVLDMKNITVAAHKVGAYAGFDLAHAVGNIPLSLHDWNVDFAVWCHYKYLNSGPGAVGGCYVHESHSKDNTLPRFTGWWGHNQDTRFKMENKFDPMPTAEGWQLSNPPIASLSCIAASLEVFEQAGGVEKLRAKAVKLYQYMDSLISEKLSESVAVITPSDDLQRGCQHSIKITDKEVDGRKVFETLEANGVACDWRYPNVIRVAAVPLYNTFEDIYKFISLLETAISEEKNDR
jgi:kynureninase